MPDDIIKIPNTNKHLGSCPDDGQPIWSNDMYRPESEHLYATYRCIQCKKIWTIVEVIPF